MKQFLLSVVCCALLGGVGEATGDVISVNGQSGPWDWVNGGLNSAFQYGLDDQLDPTVITTVSGVNLSGGEDLTLAYLSGMVQGAPGQTFFDAGGDPSQPNPDLQPHTNGVFPSFYMPLVPPINYIELVGTFADNQGQIVGNPFPIGNGPTVLVVPSGATQLQLGVNDNAFTDNAGSWTLNIEMAGSAVPEPSTLTLLGIGAVSLIGYRRRPRKQPKTPG